jgi:hypothetical protein
VQEKSGTQHNQSNLSQSLAFWQAAYPSGHVPIPDKKRIIQENSTHDRSHNPIIDILQNDAEIHQNTPRSQRRKWKASQENAGQARDMSDDEWWNDDEIDDQRESWNLASEWGA